MFSKLIMIYSLTNSGDCAHAERLLAALQEQEMTISATVVFIDANEINKQETDAVSHLLPNDGDRHYWMVIGENGEKAFNKLYQAQRIASEDYVFVGLHQMNLSVWRQYEDRVNHLAIPVGALVVAEQTAKENGLFYKLPDKVTEMFAVPTKPRTLDGLKKSHDNWAERWPNYRRPDLNKRSLIVTLPGDAPTGTGDMQRLFHIESAKKLYTCIRTVFHEAAAAGNPFEQLILQNGPRTGKFALERPYLFYKKNIETGEKIYEISGSEENIKDLVESGELRLHTHNYQLGTYNAHQPGDPISAILYDMLTQAKMNPVFYEFGFIADAGKKSVSSFYEPLLYLSMQENNVHILPGESTSMLGELPLYLQPQQIIVFKPSSMNAAHQATFESGFNAGYYSVWEPCAGAGFISNPLKFNAREQDDAEMVVQGISEDLLMHRKYQL